MTQLGVDESAAQESVVCWCCGQSSPTHSVVQLGSHPEVVVCLACAHFLYQEASAREDALRPSAASRLRDLLRSARRLVVQRSWHQKPVVGRLLRWLGRRLP